MKQDMYERSFEYENLLVSFGLKFSPINGVLIQDVDITSKDGKAVNVDFETYEKINWKLEEKEAMINLYEYRDFEEDYNASNAEKEWERSDDR